MKETVKYLVAENAQDDPLGVYVLHVQPPRFLARSNNLKDAEGFTVVDEYDSIISFFKGDYYKKTLLLAEMQSWYSNYLFQQQ